MLPSKRVGSKIEDLSFRPLECTSIQREESANDIVSHKPKTARIAFLIARTSSIPAGQRPGELWVAGARKPQPAVVHEQSASMIDDRPHGALERDLRFEENLLFLSLVGRESLYLILRLINPRLDDRPSWFTRSTKFVKGARTHGLRTVRRSMRFSYLGPWKMASTKMPGVCT